LLNSPPEVTITIVRSVSLNDCEKLVDKILNCNDAFEVNEIANNFFEYTIPNFEYLA